ncbi:MAG: hypothetical protein Q9219_004788 [cf. Caloplaca sp. 3 TL-2023]
MERHGGGNEEIAGETDREGLLVIKVGPHQGRARFRRTGRYLRGVDGRKELVKNYPLAAGPVAGAPLLWQDSPSLTCVARPLHEMAHKVYDVSKEVSWNRQASPESEERFCEKECCRDTILPEDRSGGSIRIETWCALMATAHEIYFRVLWSPELPGLHQMLSPSSMSSKASRKFSSQDQSAGSRLAAPSVVCSTSSPLTPPLPFQLIRGKTLFLPTDLAHLVSDLPYATVNSEEELECFVPSWCNCSGCPPSWRPTKQNPNLSCHSHLLETLRAIDPSRHWRDQLTPFLDGGTLKASDEHDEHSPVERAHKAFEIEAKGFR